MSDARQRLRQKLNELERARDLQAQASKAFADALRKLQAALDRLNRPRQSDDRVLH